jgi:DNA-binding transcriptional ArsR family regulator
MHMKTSPADDVCAVHETHPDTLSRVQAQGLPLEVIDRLSRLFSAFADPTRLRILHSLSVVDELCVCDLAVIAGLSVSAVSHQLRLLRDRDLVRARRDGRMVFYSLADADTADLMKVGIGQVGRS